MTKFAQIFSIDELAPGIEPCRDERCPVVGLHAIHPLWGAGRPPKSCPVCGRVVHAKDNVRFCSDTLNCGWSRTVRVTSPKEDKTR